jgi:hypothetical protein
MALSATQHNKPSASARTGLNKRCCMQKLSETKEEGIFCAP